MVTKNKNLQTVLCGCPGGRVGNELASTTLSGAIGNASDSERYLLLAHPLMSQGLGKLTQSWVMIEDQGLICQ
jgi:hypothetical protein